MDFFSATFDAAAVPPTLRRSASIRSTSFKAVSQQIRQIFEEHISILEPLWLDEAYLDVTENLQNIPPARDVALAIRARIKEVTGLNASSDGLGPNSSLGRCMAG